MIHLRRFHSSDALYACDSCPQKYRSEVQLQLHQKIHYKQDNKECPDCLTKFNTSEDIERHVCTQQNNAILER
ncbi:unnamed protein product [Callosobruchus maculatus]|uniref:C2H2-type domain-containing protein n=1 Tax=Callosobruchus maculatus TaxID=64391 RepID=A0A653BND5_CALMS|nr:unnamed protein product [Callosobruchus maculatus]